MKKLIVQPMSDNDGLLFIRVCEDKGPVYSLYNFPAETAMASAVKYIGLLMDHQRSLFQQDENGICGLRVEFV